MDAGQLEHRAHRSAGDHAGAGRRRLDEDAACADLHRDFVRNRPLDHRHGDQRFACLFDALADRFGNFAGFTDGETDAPFAIADDDERAEAEALPALDDLRDAIDAHDGLFEPAVVAIATDLHDSCIRNSSPASRAASASAAYAAVILETARVEHDGGDARGFRLAADRCADFLGRLDVRAASARPSASVFLARRSGDQRVAPGIVDRPSRRCGAACGRPAGAGVPPSRRPCGAGERGA